MTNKFSVSPSGRSLLHNGSDWVMCADTIWSAFVDAEPFEWEQYLRHRKQQGFNTLLISILPIINDRSRSASARNPFPNSPSKTIDPAYLQRARQMLIAAHEHGFSPALILFWYDYFPGSRALDGGEKDVLIPEERSAYLDAIGEAFGDLIDIAVVSGDEYFPPESQNDYGYAALLADIRQRFPASLTTFHTTPETDLPDSISTSPDLDFFSYQSGHYNDRPDLAAVLAGQYLAKPIRRPIVNLEPCYEAHGYAHGFGRFSATEVRHAVWSGVFGGASAGVSYGAHGQWQWHRPSGVFNNPGFSGQPFPWDVALRLPGASDIGAAARLISDHGLSAAEPAPELLPGNAQCQAMTTEQAATIAVYVPYAQQVELAVDLTGRSVFAMEADGSRRFIPTLKSTGSGTSLLMTDHPGATLFVFSEK